MDNFADYIAEHLQLPIDTGRSADNRLTRFVSVPYTEDSYESIREQLDVDLPLVRRRLGPKCTVSNVDVEFVYENGLDIITMYYDIDYNE